MKLIQVAGLFCIVLVTACASFQELSLPPQRSFHTGYSFVPPDEKGWFIVDKRPDLAYLGKRGSAGESYVIRVGTEPLGDFKSSEEFLKYAKTVLGVDPVREKLLTDTTESGTVKGQPCVRRRITVEDHGRTPGPDFLIVESYALVCPHPQTTVAVVVAYSHRYNPGSADPESSKKAARLFDTLEFETLAPAAVADSLARRYAARAEAARDAGNWREERLNIKLAIANAEVAGEPSAVMHRMHYENGRASGVLCDWTEAEAELKKALDIARSDSAPAGVISSNLVELGRMHFDQRHFSVAAEHFSQAYPLLQEAGFEPKDPLGVARFLDEYATALEQTQKDAEARPLRTRALELRNKFPGEKAKSDRTPYGTQCNKS